MASSTTRRGGATEPLGDEAAPAFDDVTEAAPGAGSGLTVAGAVALAHSGVTTGPTGEAAGDRRLFAVLQRAALVALVAIAVLNVADVVTTRALLGRGATESNPLAGLLLGGYRVEAVKFAALAVLGFRFHRNPSPSVGRVAAAWFVAGFYFLTVVSNLLILRRL